LSSHLLQPVDDAARRRAEAHVRSLVEWKRRDKGIGQEDVPGRPIRSVGIVGAGMMGAAIAAACVKHELAVVLTDSSPEALASAADRIAAEIAGPDVKPEEVRSRIDRLVSLEADQRDVAHCDLVLESVVETLAGKQAVYASLETHIRPEAILASNTSTIPIARLADGLASPDRFCGIHFFHPVRHRPLVEIIRGPKTTAATVATAVAFGQAIEKLPLVVDDGPGFLVNRLLVPYLNEALELLLDGATVDQIESAAAQFGMARGPLRLMDEIGLDTTFLGGRVLWEAFPERVVASPLLISMVKSGLLGRKSAAGFFRYSDVPGPAPRRSLDELIATWARPPQVFSTEAILARLLLPMVLEAARLLEKQTVGDPREIDLATLFGLGFPAWRGGLLYWADAIRPARILELLQPLAPLGARAAPTPWLMRRAEEGKGFY
jgi:3-hydroxyacyl-CoA dehydrogenase/enoyl-CoA hydratase/3-hydroxybutyryl-CoA epimerase/3-hydroxyacyl-CoA dehydrogenase/enoyl-CoA hydratase/3-hydroxybutyryl-CoA epimerase/enoyl-CoA isomerase